jgi:uncharacterized protein YneF (UPF0154 family)
MTQQKEVDIISLLAGAIVFIKKYFIVLCVTLVVGIVVGILDFYFGKNYYRTNLIASSPVINNQVVYEIAEPIKFFISNEMYDTVAAKLNISVDVAKNIKRIDMDTSIFQAVKIELDLYDKKDIKLVQEGLMYYFNSIPFVMSSINVQKGELKTYIDVLDKEISDLNNIQDAVLANLKSNQAGGVISPSGMFDEIVTMYDKRIELVTQFSTLQPFKVINANVVFVSQKSLKKNIAIFGVLGIILGTIIGVFVDIKRLTQKRLKEKKSQ